MQHQQTTSSYPMSAPNLASSSPTAYASGASGMARSSSQQTFPIGQQSVQSERLMSSSIIGRQALTAMPEETVQYVEIPVYEEVIRHVTKKEIIEVEKRVPRYEYEWIEKIVEVPEIQIVDKHVEVPQYHEVIKHVPVKQVVEVPKEVVRYVPRIETKIIEREVEVVGETIEVPKPYLVENKIVVPKYIDKEVPTVIAQRLHPVITESETDFVDVELKEYNPQLIPVDVYIPRPVARNLIASAKYEEHRVVDVPPAQYNALVKNLNPHINEKDTDGIYVKMADGSIPMLHGLGSSIIPPQSNEWEKYHTKGQSHVVFTHGSVTTTTTSGMKTKMGTVGTISSMGGMGAMGTSSGTTYNLTRGQNAAYGAQNAGYSQNTTYTQNTSYGPNTTFGKSAGYSTSYPMMAGGTTTTTKSITTGA